MFQQIKLIKNYSPIDLALWGSFILFFIGLIFHFRAFSSISIFLILFFSLIHNKINTNRYLLPQIQTFFLLSCILFFLLKLIALSYTDNTSEGISKVRITSALLFLPLAIYNSFNFLTYTRYKKLIYLFTIILLSAVVYCLSLAIYKSIISGNNNWFFYHQLVSPLNHHAIHFSLLLFFNIIFFTELLCSGYFILNKVITLSIIFIFSIFLVLLSSKLVLLFFLIFILFLFMRIAIAHSTWMKYIFMVLPISLILILFFTTNPISTRFRDLTTTNLYQLKQKEFGEGYYFNGLQFRLLQWRFVYEILEEENKWIQGVTPGDSQTLLNNKYTKAKMYSGNPNTDDTGFIGLNTHNQFLQAFLELGIIGLFSFLFICFSLIKMILVKKAYQLYFINGALLVFCFTDTPLEAQYSIMLFLFFPSFLYAVIRDTNQKKINTTKQH